MTHSPSPDNPKPKTGGDDHSIGETWRTIALAILIAMVIRTFAFEPFNIPSSSMVPTLLIGDYLFVSKFSYGYGSTGTFWGLIPFKGRIFEEDKPQRGDVVVFKLPRDPSIDYIKRLIGLPGDRIQMKDGILYINGKPVARSPLPTPVAAADEEPPEDVTDYVEQLPNGVKHIIREESDTMPLDNTDVFIVPPGHYFMMGDNRDNSQDSRTTTVGYVPASNLVGKAEILFFSLEDNTHFWEFWKWPWAVRWHRVFMKIH